MKTFSVLSEEPSILNLWKKFFNFEEPLNLKLFCVSFWGHFYGYGTTYGSSENLLEFFWFLEPIFLKVCKQAWTFIIPEMFKN